MVGQYEIVFGRFSLNFCLVMIYSDVSRPKLLNFNQKNVRSRQMLFENKLLKKIHNF